MNRSPSHSRKRARQNMLEVRVMSPRIAWIGFLRLLGKLLKFACILAVLTSIGWSIWRGIEHTFYKNPDFRLQVIDLNENPVIDEIALIDFAGIDLARNPSLFDVDVESIKTRLQELPAVVEAKVERHLPGTLMIRVTCRRPEAWVAETGTDLANLRRAGGLLVDPQGYVYPCPERQLHEAEKLPILLVAPLQGHPLSSGQTLEHPELAHCFNLLANVRKADPQSTHWIETIRQANNWSLRLVTRQGTSATFGLSNHERQINKLRAALRHAADRGYQIDTINLIPKFNVPITVRGHAAAPRAIPVSEASVDRPAETLSSLLERH